jgi:hypothetical protein
VGSESGQNGVLNSCRIWFPTQLNTPPPHTHSQPHTVRIYRTLTLGREGVGRGGGEPEKRLKGNRSQSWDQNTNMTAVWRIRDVYPGSRIPDLGSRIQKQQQKRGVKKNFFVITFYAATNFSKLQIILVSLSSQKYGFGIRDPRSGIRKKPIPDPGSRIQGSKRHRIPDPDPQHCMTDCISDLQPYPITDRDPILSGLPRMVSLI